MESHERILYDLLDVHDWPELTEVLPAKEASSLWRVLAALTKSCMYHLQYPVRLLTGKLFVVHQELVQLLSAKLSWQLALTSDGTQLAVVQDKCVEIRSLREDFQTVTATYQIDNDPKPQWRKCVWSEDNVFVAIGLSTGAVVVISLISGSVRRLPAATESTDAGCLQFAVAGLSFISPTQRHEHDGLLLAVLEYHGSLSTYQLKANEEPLLLHTFYFHGYYPSGVGSVLYHPALRLLIVGSCCDTDGDTASVSGWRLLDGAPYWAPMLGQQIKKKRRGMMSRLTVPKGSSKPENALVVSMNVSPDGMLLASCDVSGRLSVWDLPSFRLRNTVCATQVPTLSEEEKETVIATKGLLDVKWWSNEALIIVGTNGHLSVLHIDGLDALLGKALESGSTVTAAHRGQVLILQSETRAHSVASRCRVPSLSEESEHGDEDKPSLSKSTQLLMKQVLYFITDSERFRPPVNKTKMLTTKYHLSCLRSISPEEYCARKMRCKDYDAALTVAQQYGLDCDLVYQAQWHSSPVSEDAIQKYLAKISKQRWILHECLSRVPGNFEAAKQLLLYGLSRTTALDFLGVTGQAEPGLEPGDQIAALQSLCTEQQTMCEFRMLLLKYFDRLSTYERIVSHPECSLEFYDADFYKSFRNGNLLHYAVLFARVSDSKALEFLFTFHGEDLLDHRLPILSNFPETTSPTHYKALLPAVSNGAVERWSSLSHRDADWVESAAIQRLCVRSNLTDDNLTAFLYEKQPDLERFTNPNPESAAEWYSERASEIEDLSGQVDSALGLIECGIENGVQGLEALQHWLLTLSDLVYECGLDSPLLSLVRLQAVPNVDIITLMMKEHIESDFIPHFYRCALPFIQRVRSNQSGGSTLLEEYVLSVAQDDLSSVLELLQHEAQLVARCTAFSSPEEMVDIAVKSIYTCKKSQQTKTAQLMLSSLASLSYSEDLSENVAILQHQIRACVVLEGHEVLKPIYYVQQIQSDTAEVEMLIVQVMQVACRREPQLSDEQWGSLLSDILRLRKTVFTCIEEQHCYKIFVERLLCSGCQKYIEFAGQFLARSPSEVAVTALKMSEGSPYHIPYDISVSLVLQATQEYFNSASSLMDSDMDLARACINLFSSAPPVLQDELDLIASLAILDDFKVKLLPVQIRLSPNKLDIIQSIIKFSNAYKQCDKLFSLARMLKVGDHDVKRKKADSDTVTRSMPSSQGLVTIAVVYAAIDKQDFDFANSFCKDLMKSQFAPAWRVCKDLALHESHNDWQCKISLLSFAVAHCKPAEIQFLIEELRLIEVQVLYMSHSGASTSQQESQSRGTTDSSGTASASLPLGVAAVQRMVYKSTGAMQQLIGSTSFIFSGVNPFADCTSREGVLSLCVQGLRCSSSSISVQRRSTVVLSCHPFYRSAKCYSVYEPKYNSNDHKYAFLRALSVAASPAAADSESMKVLCHLATVSDSHLSGGYLLSIVESEAVDEALCGFHLTVLSLQLALYTICLQLCVQSASLCCTLQWPYRHLPSVLLKRVTNHVASSNLADWPDQSHSLVKLLIKYSKMFADHLQNRLLLGFGLGIDIQQFSQDSEFRHVIILSLGRTSKPELFQTACSLARRHGVPQWEVYVSLLESLLTVSSLDLKQVSGKIDEFKVVEHLKKDPQEVATYLVSNVHEAMSGTNYDLLLLYYTMLQQLQSAGASLQEVVDVNIHLKLLKRVKAIIPEIDYKALMSGSEPLSVLAPALTKSNIHQIAKFAHMIPDKNGTASLTVQSVYCAFAEKLFWSGDEKHTTAQTNAEWLHRYEACHEYQLHLNPEELMKFFSETALSHNAHVQLGLNTRCNLLKRFLKFTLQRMKSEEFAKSGDSAVAREVTFSDVKHELEYALKHLQSLSDSTLELPTSVDKSIWDSQMELLDLSLSHPSKVYSIAGKLLRVGTPIETVQTILLCTSAVHPHSWNVAELVKLELLSCIETFSQNQTKCISEMECMLSSVSRHEIDGGNLVCSADIVEALRLFCCDKSNLVAARRAVLRLMEKYLQLSTEEYDLLLLHKTLCVLEDNFENMDIPASNIGTSDVQRDLFNSLLTKAESRSQFLALFTLLKAWPQSSTVLQDCWLSLLKAVAQRPAWCSSVVLIRGGIADIPIEEDERLFTVLQGQNRLEAFKLAFISSAPDLVQRVLSIVAKSSAAIQIDTDILELIMLKKQVLQLFHSTLYVNLCRHVQNPPSPSESSINYTLFSNIMKCEERDVDEKLLTSSPSEKVKRVSDVLCASGLIVEASSLLLVAQHFHPCLCSLNTALAYIKI